MLGISSVVLYNVCRVLVSVFDKSFFPKKLLNVVEESKPSASATIIAIFPPLLYPNVLVGFDPYFTVASLTCFRAANICGFSFSKPVKISASIFQSLILLNLVPRNAKRVSFVSGLFKTKPSALLNSVSILKGILLSSKKSCVIEKSSLS